jgi:hypothetical protein
MIKMIRNWWELVQITVIDLYLRGDRPRDAQMATQIADHTITIGLPAETVILECPKTDVKGKIGSKTVETSTEAVKTVVFDDHIDHDGEIKTDSAKLREKEQAEAFKAHCDAFTWDETTYDGDIEPDGTYIWPSDGFNPGRKPVRAQKAPKRAKNAGK